MNIGHTDVPLSFVVLLFRPVVQPGAFRQESGVEQVQRKALLVLRLQVRNIPGVTLCSPIEVSKIGSDTHCLGFRRLCHSAVSDRI